MSPAGGPPLFPWSSELSFGGAVDPLPSFFPELPHKGCLACHAVSTQGESLCALGIDLLLHTGMVTDGFPPANSSKWSHHMPFREIIDAPLAEEWGSPDGP